MLFFIFVTLIGVVTGFEVPYEIVESRSKGKFVVAKRDILPGDVVLEEREPLLYFTNEAVNRQEQYVPHDLAFFIVSCSVFKKLPAFRKRQIENLYAPLGTPITDALRAMIGNVRYVIPGVEEPQKFSPEDVDIFEKVSAAMRYNCFSSESGHYLFNEMSRFSHSCAANCAYHIVGPVCTCYAVTPIKAGEELTITYKGERDFQRTYERRAKYAAGKEFTCHCPRCDALGDDIRQFDCVDPDCGGVMMVRQPISKEPIKGDYYSYEGVKYVEPHLLPCTVCHRTAPADYQSKMLALEEKLPALATRFSNKINRYIDDKSTPLESWEALLREVDRYKLPRRHWMVKPILKAKLDILNVLHTGANDAAMVERKRRAALDCIEVVHNVFPHPRVEQVDAIRSVCELCGVMSPMPVLSLEEEKALLQKATRMHLIMNGRENRLADVDSMLGKVLSQLPVPQTQNLDVCAFCEESPLCVAMKRSRCGRCKQVAYCSVGCQKAHWKMHKKSCSDGNHSI